MNASNLKRTALYVAQIRAYAMNGYSQRQLQYLAAMVEEFDGGVDILTLESPPSEVQKWFDEVGLKVRLLTGFYPFAARMLTLTWYIVATILCCKLKLVRYYRFPLSLHLPKAWAKRYDCIVSFYIWPFRLLALDREGAKVIIDHCDQMADRHERIGHRAYINIAPEDERFAFENDAHSIAISQYDADEFKQLYKKEIPIALFCPAQSDDLVKLADQPLPRRIGYIAAYNHHNEDVLRSLAKPEFLATLKEKNIELVVAGTVTKRADPAILKLLADGGAKVIGEVPSLVQFYEQIGAFVNLVGPTSGIKIKSVEALIAGRVLIGTQWGSDGSLEKFFQDQILRVNWPLNPAEFAAAVTAAFDMPLGDRTARSHAYMSAAIASLKAGMKKVSGA